ncbi:hypothetical protein MHM39_15015 [Phaeobacter sp. CNT1-3]|nr:hypothetical protein [Phaeobacter sp. CNT1-3]
MSKGGNKIPITDRTIHVYLCMTDSSRKPIAMIDGYHFVFKGDTAMQARRAADEWRREAVRKDKLLSAERKKEILGEDAA